MSEGTIKIAIICLSTIAIVAIAGLVIQPSLGENASAALLTVAGGAVGAIGGVMVTKP